MKETNNEPIEYIKLTYRYSRIDNNPNNPLYSNTLYRTFEKTVAFNLQTNTYKNKPQKVSVLL